MLFRSGYLLSAAATSLRSVTSTINHAFTSCRKSREILPGDAHRIHRNIQDIRKEDQRLKTAALFTQLRPIGVLYNHTLSFLEPAERFHVNHSLQV